MRWNIFYRRKGYINSLFNEQFVEVKSFYILKFNDVACVNFIRDIDISKAFPYINECLKAKIRDVYQHSYFDHQDQTTYFNTNVFVLKKRRMIELANNYCQVFYRNDDYGWANSVVKDLSAFKIVKSGLPVRVVGFSRHTEVMN
jgi:hypothetical protein